jgi:hypothetical protein
MINISSQFGMIRPSDSTDSSLEEILDSASLFKSQLSSLILGAPYTRNPNSLLRNITSTEGLDVTARRFGNCLPCLETLELHYDSEQRGSKPPTFGVNVLEEDDSFRAYQTAIDDRGRNVTYFRWRYERHRYGNFERATGTRWHSFGRWDTVQKRIVLVDPV